MISLISIKDVKTFITDQSEDFIIEEKDKGELLFLIQEIENQVKKVRDFADINTKQLVAETLAMHSNFTEGLWREKFEIEAREQGIVNRKELEEYIFDKLKQNEDFIQKKEKAVEPVGAIQA